MCVFDFVGDTKNVEVNLKGREVMQIKLGNIVGRIKFQVCFNVFCGAM